MSALGYRMAEPVEIPRLISEALRRIDWRGGIPDKCVDVASADGEALPGAKDRQPIVQRAGCVCRLLEADAAAEVHKPVD